MLPRALAAWAMVAVSMGKTEYNAAYANHLQSRDAAMSNFLWTYFVGVVLSIGPLVQSGFALGIEDFGNKPLVEANYKQWPGIMPLINDEARVYRSWVNGNEHFLFKGDVRRLNAALNVFGQLNLKKLEVVLVPGPCVGHSLQRDKEVAYNWELRIIGGIALQNLGHSKHPVLTVCVGGDIDLSKLEIPETVTVTSRGKPEDKTAAEGDRRETLEKIDAFIAARRGTN